MQHVEPVPAVRFGPAHLPNVPRKPLVQIALNFFQQVRSTEPFK